MERSSALVSPIALRGKHRLRWLRELQMAVAEDTVRTSDMLIQSEGWPRENLPWVMADFVSYLSALLDEAVEMGLDTWFAINGEVG